MATRPENRDEVSPEEAEVVEGALSLTRETRKSVEQRINCMWSVYVLYSKNFKKSYVGFSANVLELLVKHNSGRVTSTKKYRPWEVIYEEKCESELLARKREKYYKSSAGRRRLKKIFTDLGYND